MNSPLITYLQDHLLGSNFAIALLETWHANHEGTDLAAFADRLRREIESDRVDLRQLIETLGGDAAPSKGAINWIAEKASHAKFNSDEEASFEIFEGLEMLSLGILGKVALWEMLGALSRADPHSIPVDLERLSQRARDQHGEVERRRISMGTNILRQAGDF